MNTGGNQIITASIPKNSPWNPFVKVKLADRQHFEVSFYQLEDGKKYSSQAIHVVGQVSVIPNPPPGLRNKADLYFKFMAWYDAEKDEGLGWLKNLDYPPLTNTPRANAGWGVDPALLIPGQRYHPNASSGLRKVGKDGRSGAQAMYDSNDRLITSGLSAGTADKVSPSKDVNGHKRADVYPFEWALELDDATKGRRFRDLYIEVRPPNVDPASPPNPLD